MPAWDFGTVQLSDWDADGFLGIQIDPVASDEDPGGMPLAEAHHPYGFFGRPRDPDADGRGCSVLTMRRGSRERYAFVKSDPRTLELIPNGTKGVSYQFAFTDAGELSFHEIDGETGTHSIYVPDGDSAHFVQIGVDDNGASVLNLQHSEGMAVVMFEEKTILHSAGGGVFVEISDDGILCNGALKTYGGFEAGGDGALPLVLHPAMATALTAFCNAINAIIPATGSPDSGAAVATQLKAAATALAAALAGTASTLTKGL
jgi:hypothetical protein